MVRSVLAYRIDSGAFASTLRLADGRILDSNKPQLVINRLTALPTVRSSSPADVAYLAEEWRATVVAWLRTLPGPVLNPPLAASLIGPTMSAPAWRAVGAAHGVPVRDWRSEVDDRPVDPVEVVCVGGRCIDATGTVPADLGAPLAAMARHVGAPLLGMTLDRSGRGWELLDATPFPRLVPGGDALIEAVLACALEEERTR